MKKNINFATYISMFVILQPMSKRIFLGLAAAAIATLGYAQTAVVDVYETVSQNASVERWVPDCTKGELINKNADNWFISLEGGANMLFGKHDIKAELKDRVEGNGALYVGKWVTPSFGFRVGVNYIMTKGVTTYEGGEFQKWNVAHPTFKDNIAEYYYVDQKWMGLGPEFDVMINLTNWWCGYRPGRVYNAVIHGGAGAYWRWGYKKIGDPEPVKIATDFEGYDQMYYPDSKLKYARHMATLFGSIGLQQNFRVSKHLDLFIDLQYEILRSGEARNAFDQIGQINLGCNINLGNTGWSCPVVPVCTDVTPLRNEIASLQKQLADLEAKGRQLQAQLAECLARKIDPIVVGAECSQLVTVYYPINVYSLSSREKNILRSIADIMKANPSQKYDLIGWADNWTGTAQYNEDLRWKRVNGVKNYLVSCGVPESQLNATVNAANLASSSDYNEFKAGAIEAASAPLDRAVTIRLAD